MNPKILYKRSKLCKMNPKMLSLLLVVLPLASAAKDVQTVNEEASPRKDVRTFDKIFDVDGLFFSGMMGVSVSLMLAYLLGFNLSPKLTGAADEIGENVLKKLEETVLKVLGRSAISTMSMLGSPTIDTMAMVVDKAVQTFEQMQD